MTMHAILLFALVWLNGFGVGGLLTVVVIWWRLVTGRATVRPLDRVPLYHRLNRLFRRRA